MARLNINPTRMELTRLKTRLRTAVRGHKLLKDKRDELMKQFLDLMRKNRDLRRRVEKRLVRSRSSFTAASAVMSPEAMRQELMCPKQGVILELSYKNIMSVNVPQFSYRTKNPDPADIYPYGYAFTTAALDDALSELAEVFEDMIELAQVEKSVQLMAAEIERTRRRVNALEYVMIPQLEETIRYITMKLDENERGNLTRLMKVKDMMLEQERLSKQAAQA